MARQSMSCARFASSRALPHFAEKILLMIPGVTKGWRESNQDGRMESSLVCLTGVTSSTWAQRDMHKVRIVRRREATDRVDLTFLHSVSARPLDGPN